jgi:multiple sugar transport system substrate-binding protein
MALRVALVAGPMYDHIRKVFHPGEVEIVAEADHPTLNRTVAEMLHDGVRIDVLSTHSKYAPSQINWLTPLDDPSEGSDIAIDTSQLAPKAVELCQFQGRQWCVPRLIDVRLNWYRTDRIETPPATWDDLVQSTSIFGFTGRESGAFGMFFELVVGAGGQLFDQASDATLRPMMNSVLAVEALHTMQQLSRRAPNDLPSWQYDDVDLALFDGRIDMAAAWPGGWSALAKSKLPFAPALYPSGSVRHVSYSGCHAWAIPRTCGDIRGATELVQRLCDIDAQSLDASAGSMCAHITALQNVEPLNAIDQKRLELTQHTIDQMMITYPSLPRFPTIEDAGSYSISALLRGEVSASQAADRIQKVAVETLLRSSRLDESDER